MSLYPFEYEGKIWPTSEQCYQAYKHSDEEYREKIRHCDDIYEVIDMGRKHIVVAMMMIDGKEKE